MKNLKYIVKLLGLTDYYGNSNVPPKYSEWMQENCKGKWFYYSPDAPCPNGEIGPKPKIWPMFFEMQFHFSRKKEMEEFSKKFS